MRYTVVLSDERYPDHRPEATFDNLPAALAWATAKLEREWTVTIKEATA